MAESSAPGLGDLLALFGGANPFASIGKTIDQFKRGVNDFLTGVETFNATMESLNGVTVRINRLLDDVEEPIQALMPQVTRSIKTADAVFSQLSVPVEKITPGLLRLADMLSSPGLINLPREIAGFVETLGDLATRLQPLTQMAESAGSLFGLRPLSVLRGGSTKAQPTQAPTAEPAPAAKKAPAKMPAATKALAKKPAAKKAPAKKAPATKAPAKRAAATTKK
ncbi:MAG: hypothetical protein NTX77_13100 [Actinobacteria bacterium]|nr:hypothetical protein [Actinomycetota bacterium]